MQTQKTKLSCAAIKVKLACFIHHRISKSNPVVQMQANFRASESDFLNA